MRQCDETTLERLPHLIGTLGFSRRRCAAALNVSYQSMLRALTKGRRDCDAGCASWQASLVQRIEQARSQSLEVTLTRLSEAKDAKSLMSLVAKRFPDCVSDEPPEADSELGEASVPFAYLIARVDLGPDDALADHLTDIDTFRTALIRLHQRCGRRMPCHMREVTFDSIESGFCTDSGAPIARRLSTHFGWSFVAVVEGEHGNE